MVFNVTYHTIKQLKENGKHSINIFTVIAQLIQDH